MAQRSDSIDSSDRVDQIIRVDAHALLKTIRDIEYKLSDHHRNEKKPTWAIALEDRLDKLEQLGWSSLPQNVKPETTSGTHEMSNDGSSSSSKGLTMYDFAHDDRLMTRMREEIDAKVASTKVMMEAKVITATNEIDRLHKLLQLRPTISDMQQIVVTIRETEQKSNDNLSDFSRIIDGQIQEKLTSEVEIINKQLENNRQLSERSNELVTKQISDVFKQITLIQQSFDNSLNSLQEQVTKNYSDYLLVLPRVTKLETDSDTNLSELRESIKANKLLIENNTNVMNENSLLVNKHINELDEKIVANKDKAYEDFLTVTVQIKELASEVHIIETNLSSFKQNNDNDIKFIKSIQSETTNSITVVKNKLKEIDAILNELMNYDYTGRLAKHDDLISKNNFEILDVRNTIANLEKNDIHNINEHLALLQTEMNKQPELFNVTNNKIKALVDKDNSIADEIVRIDDSLLKANDRLAELIPYKARVTNLEDFTVTNKKELDAIQASLTNNIDETEEIKTKVIEVQENISEFDENIANRMNMIRDTLMDTMLEKQNETNLAVRNVKENLEAMAMAGEPGVNIGGGGGVHINGGGGIHIGANIPRDGSGSVPSKGSLVRTSQSIRGSDEFSANDMIDHYQQSGGPMKKSPSFMMPNSGMNRQQSFVPPNLSPSNVLKGAPPATVQRQPSIIGPSRKPSIMGIARQPSVVENSICPPPGIMKQSSLLGYQSHGNKQPLRSSLGATVEESSDLGRNSTSVTSNTNNESVDESSIAAEKQKATEDARGNKSASAVPPAIKQKEDSRVNLHSPNHDLVTDSIDSHGDDSRSDYHSDSGYDDSSLQSSRVGTMSRMVSFGKILREVEEEYVSSNRNDNDSAVAMKPEEMTTGVQEFSQLMTNPQEYILYDQSQFVADLCLNYEEISFKRKRVSDIPLIICENIATILQELSEFIAKTADSEMVQSMLAVAAAYSVNASHTPALQLSNMTYDENFVINCRQRKMDEFMDAVTLLVISNNPQPGVNRMDARSIFLAAVRKALEMFMTKHNQV